MEPVSLCPTLFISEPGQHDNKFKTEIAESQTMQNKVGFGLNLRTRLSTREALRGFEHCWKFVYPLEPSFGEKQLNTTASRFAFNHQRGREPNYVTVPLLKAAKMFLQKPAVPLVAEWPHMLVLSSSNTFLLYIVGGQFCSTWIGRWHYLTKRTSLTCKTLVNKMTEPYLGLA